MPCKQNALKNRGAWQTFSSNSVTNAPRKITPEREDWPYLRGKMDRGWRGTGGGGGVDRRADRSAGCRSSIKILYRGKPREIIFDSNLTNGTGMQSIYLHLASTNRGDSIVGRSCPFSFAPSLSLRLLVGPHRFCTVTLLLTRNFSFDGGYYL